MRRQSTYLISRPQAVMRPARGPYWKVLRTYAFYKSKDIIRIPAKEVEEYFFLTIKDLTDFLETHGNTIVTYVRQA